MAREQIEVTAEERQPFYSTEEDEAHELRAEIRDTRDQLDSTLEEIKERLSPKEVAGTVAEIGSELFSQQLSDQKVDEFVQIASRQIGSFIRRHPYSCALFGIAALLLLAEREKRKRNNKLVVSNV